MKYPPFLLSNKLDQRVLSTGLDTNIKCSLIDVDSQNVLSHITPAHHNVDVGLIQYLYMPKEVDAYCFALA